MLISEIIPLDEKAVDSSWIHRVDYGQYYKQYKKQRSPEENKKSVPKFSDVIITVRDGRKYTVHNVPYSLYKKWESSPSKGQFWHKFIRNQYNIS